MASQGVSGWTAEEVEEKRREYNEKYGDREDKRSFEERYCLARIPRQPDDYDGPQRYCAWNHVFEVGSEYICPAHGGAGHGNPENLDKLAAMKHGMKALRENLRRDFDDKDLAIYEWIVEQYPEAYGIDIESSPADAYDIHRLACEIVRAERGRGYLISEGEVKEKEVRDEDGHIVTDKNGEVVTEKSEHYLARMMDRQDSKITEIEKELGISRKERLRRNENENATEVVKGLAEIGLDFIDRDEKEYDPDDEPWTDSNENQN